MRILLLEDSKSDTAYIELVLTKDVPEAELRCISTSEFIEEVLAAWHPEIVLSDYSLVGDTAIDVIQRIRACDPDLPVIVISGRLDDEGAVACIRQGAVDYVLKDRIVRLPIAIQRAMDNRRLLAEKRRAETERTHALERLRQHIERLPIGYIIANAQFVPTYMNPAAERMFGLTIERMQPDCPLSFIALPAGQADPGLLERWKRGEFESSGTSEVTTCDHRTIMCEWINTPVFDPTGAFDGIISHVFDATERLERERALEVARHQAENADRLKTAFVANVSHEIRTPLNIIIGYASLLIDELPADVRDRASSYFASIERSSDRLMNTIGELLNISSIQAGTFNMHLEPVQVRPLLYNLVADMRHRAQDAGLTLECAIDGTPVVIGDRASIERALINVLDNAIKFTSSGGVAVRAGTRGGHVRIEIEDTGIGISAEYLPHVYDIFSQEETGYTRPFEGLGLGTALSRLYIEANQGTINMKSTKGKGTLVTVELRAAPCPD